MALYTDADHVTLADMLAVDPEVADVAAAEGITVEGAGGIIPEAWAECRDQILGFQQSFHSLYTQQPGTGWNRRLCHPNQMHVSDTLERWMLYRVMMLFYRAARNRRVSDRYREKYDFYRFDERDRWRSLWAAGLPVVWQPLPAPGAVHEFNPGTWGSSNVTAVAGGSQSGTVTYDVAITWTDSSKYVSATNKGNAESGAAALVSISVPEAKVIRVSLSGLVPPDGVFRGNQADGAYTPLKATHWNVYVGAQGGTLYLQTSSPITVEATTYTMADAPVLSGAALEAGQRPDAIFPFQAALYRA